MVLKQHEGENGAGTGGPSLGATVSEDGFDGGAWGPEYDTTGARGQGPAVKPCNPQSENGPEMRQNIEGGGIMGGDANS